MIWRQLSRPICCMSCYLTVRQHVHHLLLGWSGFKSRHESGCFFLSSLREMLHFVCFWRDIPHWNRVSSFTRFLDHTQRRNKIGRTPLEQWSAHRIDLYLTTHNNHNRQTTMPPVRFETTISAGERPQTYALDRAAAGIGKFCSTVPKFSLPLPSTPV
jgi:hypothetical protein